MAEVAIKGWCPTALRPMPSGDGLMVRIRPPLARLTAAQAQGLAEAALRHGSGLIDVTARGCLQLRGVRAAAHPALIDELRRLGLIDNVDQRILVMPYWRDGDGTAELVSALERALAAPDAPVLPDKFGFAVGVSRASALHKVSADIRIEWHLGGIIVRPDSFATGTVVRTPAQAAEAAAALARWFVAQGGLAVGRMARLWMGEDFRTRQARLPFRNQAGGACLFGGDPIAPGPHPLGVLVGLEFGQLRAEALAALARQPMRVTPWRMLLLEGVETAPDLPGLVTAPDDPRLRVTACTGAPGCLQGLQPTRALARDLASSVPEGQHLHVSGCAKGCAHPGPADVVLTATAAGYAVIRNGRASDPPIATYPTSTSLFKAL